MTKYQNLFAGCVRQKGDEVRKLGYKGCGRGDNYTGQGPDEFIWHEVTLIGRTILQSDLMIAEFRREVAID